MSKEITKTTDIKQLEQEFVVALGNGIEAMRNAGKILVRLIDFDKDAVERLISERGIPRATLTTLCRIGRGELLPELAFKPSMGRLPINEQKVICGGTVDAVVIREGKTDTIKVDLRNAIPSMVSQVIAFDHIRSLSEQVQYIETKKKTETIKTSSVEGVPWRVKHGKIDILRPVQGLTRGDLLTMQRAMEV